MPRMIGRSVAAALLVALGSVLADAAGAARPGREDLRSAAAAEPAAPARKGMPTEDEVSALIQETLGLFVRAVAERDMAALRAEASAGVQRQLSVAEINQTFRPFFDVGLEVDMLDGLAPAVRAIRQVGSDAFVVDGRFMSEPQPLAFRLSFVREGLVWRWSYIHVALLPAGPQAD